MKKSVGKKMFKINGRAWSHPSVLVLMEQKALANEGPEDVVKRLARELVARAKADQWSGPPFDPDVLASSLGIRVEAHDELRGAEARILPISDGRLLIQFDPTSSKRRINFSICHELAHTFFPDCFEFVRHRAAPNSEDRTYLELEYLCDLGAAELLMPHADFLTDLSNLPLSLDGVKTLSNRYEASNEAVLIRIAQLASIPCAVVFLSEKFKPKEKKAMATPELDLGLPPLQPKMRVDYVCPSDSFGVFIPKDKSVPTDSAVCRCLDGDDVAEGDEEWDIKGFGRRRVHAAKLPAFQPDAPRRVAALVLGE